MGYPPARRVAMGGLFAIVACSGGDSGPSSPTSPTETPTPALASMSPGVLVEGASAVLSGSDFASTPSANSVTVDGIAATVTAATTTQLTITVPTFGCRPQRMVSVQVSVGGKGSNALTQPVEPGAFVDLDVGEMALIEDPEDFCLQFPPASAGAGAYLVGVGAAAERPDDLLSVSMSGTTGQGAPVALSRAAAAPASPVSPEGSSPGGERRMGDAGTSRWKAHTRTEERVRGWEREWLGRARLGAARLAGDPGSTRSSRVPGTTPSVGDPLQFKVPDLHASTPEGLCAPIPVSTVVRAVGARGIFVTDVDNPQADALTDADIQALSDAFDAYIYDTNTQYLGTPLDLDGNERVVVLFSIEVNKFSGGGFAFVWAGDFFKPEDCAASDVGEIYYSTVPDPGNVAGTKARSRETVVDWFPQVLAHEFAHVIQVSVRLRELGTSRPLTPWESEGQATLATEVVGHRATGLTPGQGYKSPAVLSESGKPWYQGPLFVSLATYYGYDGGSYSGFEGAGERRPDAPDTCTLFFSQASGCVIQSGYGASWSFFRYVADRFGPTWPGGEAGLMQDWIGAHPTLAGHANVEALLGMSFTELFAQWAAMHYVDDRVTGADPALLLSSWNLHDIMPAVGENAPLLPKSRSFSNFATSLSIRGGSTAYSLFDDAMPRPAVAVSVRDAGGAVLSTDMKPHLWVVRVR